MSKTFNRAIPPASPRIANQHSVFLGDREPAPGIDLKRHDVGPNFYERNFDGTTRTEFLTTPLWGVGSTGSYGHDRRSINLMELILRHGGEAQSARDAFAAMSPEQQERVIAFLNSLVILVSDH